MPSCASGEWGLACCSHLLVLCPSAVLNPLSVLPCSPRGLVGNTLSCDSGEWERTDAGVGAGVDSFYEYLLKVSQADSSVALTPWCCTWQGCAPCRILAQNLLPSLGWEGVPPSCLTCWCSLFPCAASLCTAHCTSLPSAQAYLAFGDEGYLSMFKEVYAAAMTNLQLDPAFHGTIW